MLASWFVKSFSYLSNLIKSSIAIVFGSFCPYHSFYQNFLLINLVESELAKA